MKDYKQELTDKVNEEWKSPNKFDNRSGRIFGGLVLVVIGGVFLARQFGIEFPVWLFSWSSLLIVLGIFIGARHSFKGLGWLIPIIIGGVLLMQDLYPEISFKAYIWPVLIISMGLFMIFRPRRNYHDWNWDKQTSGEEFVDATAIFGGTKRNIISKNFKGGDITNVFGGAEIDMTQADIQGTVVVDATQVFGGIKLIVPANWTIKSDVTCIFGSVEDKRKNTTTGDPNKVLHLNGTCVFGGIEIKSF
jgi:predicted membrane protein